MSTRLSLTGLSPSLAGFPKTVLLNSLNQFRGPNPSMHARWFGLFRFRSPLLTESHVVFSSSGYLDVSVHRVPSSHTRGDSTTTAGFPHSEICGSLVTCTSPQLIAAYRVLLRLIWPRHPPYALTYLTYLLSFLRFELSNFLKRSFLFLTFSCSCQGTGERIDLSKLNNTNPMPQCRPKDGDMYRP